MDKKELGLYLQVGSIVAGAITALVLINAHPVPIIILGVEAGIYFVGEYLKK